MKSLILVMAGGSIGSGLRYLLSRRLQFLSDSSSWPWGTFAVNLLGGLAMGLLIGWLMMTDRAVNSDMRLLLGVGLLGGFTTFSAFSLEMASMIERGLALQAFGYAAASVLLALAAVFAGLSISRTLLGTVFA
jgi:fluoride exporter